LWQRERERLPSVSVGEWEGEEGGGEVSVIEGEEVGKAGLIFLGFWGGGILE